MKISAGSSKGGPIKKSQAAKKADKKLEGRSEANRERYYKVKAKASDPGARLGIARDVKVKEISKEQRDRLANKEKNIKKNAENSGRLDASVKKAAGVYDIKRIKASKNAHQKSNLSIGGKITKATGGRPSTQQEKATYGKYKYVGTKSRMPFSTIPSKTVLPKEAAQKRTMAKMSAGAAGDYDVSTRAEEKTAAKRMSVVASSKAKTPAVKKPALSGAKTSSKKYFIKVNGKEEQVSEDTKKKFPNRFK